MPLLIFTAMLGLLNITSNSAQENDNYSRTEWVTESDSSSNRLVSEIIMKSGLTDRIDLIKQLGMREDRDFCRIAEDIYYSLDCPDRDRELILYFTVNSFIKSPGDYEINRNVFEEIFYSVDSFSESILRKEIIRKTEYTDKKTALKILTREGRMLAEMGRENSLLNPVILEECRVYRSYSEKYSEAVLDQINDVIYRNVLKLQE